MMQLADYQIKALAKLGMIKPFYEKRLNSFGYDMGLGRTFKRFIGNPDVVDVNNMKEEYFEEFLGDYAIIPPHSFILGISIEYFQIPKNIMCICLGRSSYSRVGIIPHITPLEPEWRGFVTIEISNVGNLPTKVYANQGISQIVFLEGMLPNKTYADRGGRYNDQQGITISKGV